MRAPLVLLASYNKRVSWLQSRAYSRQTKTWFVEQTVYILCIFSPARQEIQSGRTKIGIHCGALRRRKQQQRARRKHFHTLTVISSAGFRWRIRLHQIGVVLIVKAFAKAPARICHKTNTTKPKAFMHLVEDRCKVFREGAFHGQLSTAQTKASSEELDVAWAARFTVSFRNRYPRNPEHHCCIEIEILQIIWYCN